MAIQYINTGSSANAGNGDSLRSAFVKVNNNFAYLSTATGGGGGGYTGSQGYTGSASAGYTGSQGNIGYTGSAPNLPLIANTTLNPGSIAYYNTTGTIIGASKLLINDLDGSLAIFGSGTAPALGITYDAYTGIPLVRTAQFHENIDAINFSFLRARGSLAAPQTVQVGDEIGEISWDTYDSTGTYVVGALLSTVVDQAPTAGQVPMSFRFITHNGIGYGTRLFISSTGTVGFNRLAALGNAAIANTIEVGSNFIPTANLAYDLGSTSSQWRSIYVGTGTIYIGGVALGVNQDNYVTVDGNPIITVNTTGTLTVPGNILPDTDVAYDLGSPTNRFRDIYVSSSTIYLGTSTISISSEGQMLVNGNNAVSKLEYFGGEGYGPRDAVAIAWNTSTFTFDTPGKELLTAIYDLKPGNKIRATGAPGFDQEFTIVGNTREYIRSGGYQMVGIDVAETTSTNRYAWSLYLPVKDKSATIANGTWTVSVSTTGTIVYPDGSVQTGASISIAALKTLVAASTDFADFKTRIAAL